MKRKSEKLEYSNKRLRIDEESIESSSSENTHLMSAQNEEENYDQEGKDDSQISSDEESYHEDSDDETQQSSEGNHQSNIDDSEERSEQADEYSLTEEEKESWSELIRVIKYGTLAQLEEYFFSLSQEVRDNIINYCGDDEYYPVVEAIWSDNSFSKVRFLVESCGADVSLYDSSGLTPLLAAADLTEYNEELIRYLLENGANTSVNDERYGLTALSLVLGDDYEGVDILRIDEEIALRIVKLLVSYGAHIYRVEEELEDESDILRNEHVDFAVTQGYKTILQYFYEELVSKNYHFISEFINAVLIQAITSNNYDIFKQFSGYSNSENIDRKLHIKKVIEASKKEVPCKLSELAKATHDSKFALIFKKQAEFSVKKTSFILESFDKWFGIYEIDGIKRIILNYLGIEEIDRLMQEYKKAQAIHRAILKLESENPRTMVVNEDSVESIVSRLTNLSLEEVRLNIKAYWEQNKLSSYSKYSTAAEGYLFIRIIANIFSINIEVIDLVGNSFIFTPHHQYAEQVCIRLLDTGNGFMNIMDVSHLEENFVQMLETPSMHLTAAQLTAAAVEDDESDIDSFKEEIEDIYWPSEEEQDAQILEQPALASNANTSSVIPFIEEERYQEPSCMQLSAAAVEEDTFNINSSIFDYKVIESVYCNNSEQEQDAQILKQPALASNANTSSVIPFIEGGRQQEPSYMHLSAAAVNTTSLITVVVLPVSGEDFLLDLNLEFFSSI